MPSLTLPQKKEKKLIKPPLQLRISTNITNSLFIDGTNAVPITTGDTFGEIGLRLFHLCGFSTPTAIKASFKRLSSALRAENGSQCLTTTRTLHLFLLNMKTLYKTINISFVSPQFVKEFLGSLIGEKAIEIIALFREEDIEVDLPFLFLFLIDWVRMTLLLFHRTSFPI